VTSWNLADVSSTTAVDRGDGSAAVVIGIVLVVILIIVIRYIEVKLSHYGPDDPVPWTGDYEAKLTAHAFCRQGDTMPPPKPSQKGKNWRLKRGVSSSQWIVVAFLLGTLALLAYSQADISGLQQLSSHPTPPPAPSPARIYHHQQVQQHYTPPRRPLDHRHLRPIHRTVRNASGRAAAGHLRGGRLTARHRY
jgi:hypothetical protein